VQKEAAKFDRSVAQRETCRAFRDRRAYVAVVGEEQRRCGRGFKRATRTYGDGFGLRRKRRCVGKARERENGFPRLRRRFRRGNEADSGHRSRRRVRRRRGDVECRRPGSECCPGSIRFRPRDVRFRPHDVRCRAGGLRCRAGGVRFRAGDVRFRAGGVRFRAPVGAGRATGTARCSARPAWGHPQTLGRRAHGQRRRAPRPRRGTAPRAPRRAHLA